MNRIEKEAIENHLLIYHGKVVSRG